MAKSAGSKSTGIFEEREKKVYVEPYSLKNKTFYTMAEGYLIMSPDSFNALQKQRSKNIEIFTIARASAALAAKRVCEFLPNLHQNILCESEYRIEPLEDSYTLRVCAILQSNLRLPELEALNAVTVGLLALYEQCRCLDTSMVLNGIRVLESAEHSVAAWIKE